MDEADWPATLRLIVDTKGQPRAADVGRMLHRLSVSFSQYQRREGFGTNAQLRVSRLEVGSLWADLIAVAGTVVTLWEFREILTGFVQQLVKAFRVMSGTEDGIVESSDRVTIEALAAPVANDDAHQVTVQVVGDNNAVLVINLESAQSLRDAAVARAIPSTLRAHQTKAARAPIEGARLREAISYRTDRSIIDEDSADATLLFIDGQWYARPVGLSGVLLPVSIGHQSVAGLDEHTTHIAHGSIIRQASTPRRIHAGHGGANPHPSRC